MPTGASLCRHRLQQHIGERGMAAIKSARWCGRSTRKPGTRARHGPAQPAALAGQPGCAIVGLATNATNSGQSGARHLTRSAIALYGWIMPIWGRNRRPRQPFKPVWCKGRAARLCSAPTPPRSAGFSAPSWRCVASERSSACALERENAGRSKVCSCLRGGRPAGARSTSSPASKAAERR